MSDMFGAMTAASSGMYVDRKWMDAVSDNISNASDVSSTSGSAYQARYIEASAMPGTLGVEVTGTSFGSAAGREVSDPSNPLADKNGMVRMPDIDMGDQMTSLIAAQRGYEADLSAVSRLKDVYSAALEIGK
jgi:flagellar basal-body rod protein FlgC